MEKLLTKRKFKRGQKVKLKTQDPNDKNFGRIVAGPPVIIGDPHNPRGVFPIKLKKMVIVSWGKYETIERVSNITILDRRRVK
jgi:hypothetical protein